MKTLLSMPDELGVDVDKYCKDYKYERSEFIRLCIREKLYKKLTKDELFEKLKDAAEISQYNKPVAVVDPPVTEIPKNKENKFGIEFVGDLRSKQIYAQTSYGFCEKHFDKGVQSKLYEIVYEDNNGDVTVHMKMCKPCMEKMFKQASESGSIRSLEVPIDKEITKA